MNALRAGWYMLVGACTSMVFRHVLKVEIPDWGFYFVIPMAVAIMALVSDCLEKLREIQKAQRDGR